MDEFKEVFKKGRRGNILPLIINELISEFIEDLYLIEKERLNKYISKEDICTALLWKINKWEVRKIG